MNDPEQKKLPLISVVVPSFNRAEMLRGALETLTGQETYGRFRYEIFVVDNASTDYTKEVVLSAAETSDVPVYYTYESTPGDAPPRNRGVAESRGPESRGPESRGPWVAFFDDDQFADPNWLAGLYHGAIKSGAPIVGGPVLLDLSDEQLHRLGPIGRKALREITFYDALQAYVGKDLPGCGNVLIERALLERLGGFDERMNRGGSDSDFFLRAKGAGYELWYAPEAMIRHRIPAERLTTEYLRWCAYNGFENLACFDYRRFGLARFVFVCAARAGQALIIHLPLLAWAWLRGDEGGMLGRRFLLWRAEGYLRRALSLLAPRLFPQKKFIESLDFRTGFSAHGKDTDSQPEQRNMSMATSNRSATPTLARRARDVQQRNSPSLAHRASVRPD